MREIKRSICNSRQLSRNSQRELRVEILQNRDTNMVKFEELFTLKNKITGVVFLFVLIFGVFGRDIWEGFGHITHLWGK